MDSLTHKSTRRMNVGPTLHALTAGTLGGRDGYVCIIYGKARGKKSKWESMVIVRTMYLLDVSSPTCRAERF